MPCFQEPPEMLNIIDNSIIIIRIIIIDVLLLVVVVLVVVLMLSIIDSLFYLCTHLFIFFIFEYFNVSSHFSNKICVCGLNYILKIS